MGHPPAPASSLGNLQPQNAQNISGFQGGHVRNSFANSTGCHCNENGTKNTFPTKNRAKIQMKILLNSIGQILQKHGPGPEPGLGHAHCPFASVQGPVTMAQGERGHRGCRHMWMQCGVQLATAAATNDQKLHCHFYAQFVLRKYCESFRKGDRQPRWRHLAKLLTNIRTHGAMWMCGRQHLVAVSWCESNG